MVNMTGKLDCMMSRITNKLFSLILPVVVTCSTVYCHYLVSLGHTVSYGILSLLICNLTSIIGL